MAERNYYELLNITPKAGELEIEEAYKSARAVYAEDSVALYSLYSQEERESLLKMINDAYETLKDPARRKTYDTENSPDIPRHLSWLKGMETSQGVINLTDNTAETKKLMLSVKPKNMRFAMEDIDQFAAEQYRMLYTRLEHISLKNSHKIFAITSTVKGEGKTITSINLAYTMAHDFNKKVILVECDLKKPSIPSYFTEPDNGYGLIDVINGQIDIKAAIMQVENTRLYLLTARHNIKNSCELLGSQRMKTMLNTLKTEFDYIIIDSPPILPLADMNILSKIVDGLVLVVRAGRTPKDIVIKAANSIHGANMVGIVLNGADALLKKYYY
jgi:protein-tyrosine kinase